MSSAYTISYITTLPYPGTYSKNRKDRKFATLVIKVVYKRSSDWFLRMRMRHAYDIQQQTEWGEIICEGVSLKFIYRVSHGKVNKVIWLCWGYRFWFLLIFWVLCVHEIGPFMPSSSVFIQLMFRSICGPICKHLLFLSEFRIIIILGAVSSKIK